MRITIIGAGSVGMLIASFLAEQNLNVTLIVRRKEQALEIQKFGLIRKNLDGSFYTAKIQVETDFSSIKEDSLVIVAVKYGQLKPLYKTLKTLNIESPLLFLQNGLAHFQEALRLPQKTIAFGACQFGAEKESDHIVVHRGQGVLKLAVEKGQKELFKKLASTLDGKIQLVMEEDAEQMLFEKALLNCFINPITAIVRMKNGELIENEHTYHLLLNLYDELMEAFPEIKADFQFEDVKNLCIRTAANTSSMLSDRLQMRPTEAETIIGEVIKRAAKREKALPTLNTLYHLLLAIESGEKM